MGVYDERGKRRPPEESPAPGESINLGDSIDIEDMDGEDYDAICDRMREKNQRYLDIFETSMEDAGLSRRTINKHLGNVEFFLNTYLLYYDICEMEEGCYDVAGFLGNFFIYKCMWSTSNAIKENATSFKKFYKCMLDNALIEKASYDELVATIKGEMADWQAECEAFNDPDNYDDLFLDDLDYGDLDEDVVGEAFGGGPRNNAAGSSKFKAFTGTGTREDADAQDDLPPVDPELFDRIYDIVAKELGFDQLVGTLTDDGKREPPANPDTEPPKREDIIDMFTLVLFYLTSWTERIGGKQGFEYRRAWKSADWGAIDRLRERGVISCTNKAKSVMITEDGEAVAKELLEMLDLGYLE